MKDFERRAFLRGIGGVTVGLPILDVFRAHESRAQPATKKVYSVFMIQSNGAVQGLGGEPDMFWPRAMGSISDAAMAGADADRTTSELRGYASKLLMVKGMDLPFTTIGGCGHAIGCTQTLTASRPSSGQTSAKATGESVDNRIARTLTPGTEPLVLFAGKKVGSIDDVFSYRGPQQVRLGDNNPWSAYQRLMGVPTAASGDNTALQLLVNRRKSINDLVRTQLKDFLARKDLSANDRQRLDLHFSSIRDTELSMVRALGPLDPATYKAVDGMHEASVNMQKVADLHLEIIAFALASDRVRTAVLQMGHGNNTIKYTIDGVQLPPYHWISHRIYSDGATGEKIPDAVTLHHKIDRMNARNYKHLLDRLAAHTLPQGGTLLDSCIAVWCNSLSNGPPHSNKGVPWILAGGGGGFFKTGQVVNVAGATSNKMLNSILAASGVRKPDGQPVDDFGDASLPKGLLTGLHA